MLEPSACKQGCSVLRELGGGDAARLPGAPQNIKHQNNNKFEYQSKRKHGTSREKGS